MNVIIRHASVNDAHEFPKEPGFFCLQPSELTDVNVVVTITTLLKKMPGIRYVKDK